MPLSGVADTYTGVRSVDKFLVWNALDKGLSTVKIMWRVSLPASLPFIFAGLRIAATLSILLVVAAQMIASNDGLGYLAMFAQRTFRNEDMLAAIMLIALTELCHRSGLASRARATLRMARQS